MASRWAPTKWPRPARRSTGRIRRSRCRQRFASAWDARAAGAAHEAQWNERFARYRTAHPALAAEFERRIAGELPRDFEGALQTLINELGHSREAMATRKASQKVLATAGAARARVARRQR